MRRVGTDTCAVLGVVAERQDMRRDVTENTRDEAMGARDGCAASGTTNRK
jgi:hypothetical protein